MNLYMNFLSILEIFINVQIYIIQYSSVILYPCISTVNLIHKKTLGFRALNDLVLL